MTNFQADAIDRARSYGVRMNESMNVAEITDLRESVNHSIVVDWTDKSIKRILRFRLIGCSYEYPFWDISYCYAELKDGSRVRVSHPFNRLPRQWKSALIAEGKRDGVYVKGQGYFDAESTLNG